VITTTERSWTKRYISSQHQSPPISCGKTNIFRDTITSSDNVLLLRLLRSSWSRISCGLYLPSTMSYRSLKSILQLIASCFTMI
jgi:hypothetical protein